MDSILAGVDHQLKILLSGKVDFTRTQDGAEFCSRVHAMNLHGVEVLVNRENRLRAAFGAGVSASQEKGMEMIVYA